MKPDKLTAKINSSHILNEAKEVLKIRLYQCFKPYNSNAIIKSKTLVKKILDLIINLAHYKMK